MKQFYDYGKRTRIEKRHHYRVEAETGAGWVDRFGRPFPVFTTAEYPITNDIKQAKEWMRDRIKKRPLYRVRVIRVDERRSIVAEANPKT